MLICPQDSVHTTWSLNFELNPGMNPNLGLGVAAEWRVFAISSQISLRERIRRNSYLQARTARTSPGLTLTKRRRCFLRHGLTPGNWRHQPSVPARSLAEYLLTACSDS